MNIVFCKWDREPILHFLDRGASMVLIVDRSDLTWEEMPDLILNRMVKIYEVETTDSIDEMSAVSVDLELTGFPIHKVLASHEQAQYGASFLAQRLGLNQTALANMSGARDKRYMKYHAEKAGVSVARFATITSRDNEKQIENVADHVGFPMVVKPVNGMATISTVRVHNLHQLKDLMRDFDYGPSGIHSRQLIVEESIEGDEYHVDAVWRDNEPWIFSISKYFCPRLTLSERRGINGSYILAETEHAEFYAATLKMHTQVNSALEIKRGITHLEMFHTPRTGELVFSEVATRPGGGGAISIVEQKYGPNLNAAWAEETLNGSQDDLDWKSEQPFPYVGWLNITPETSGIISILPDTDKLLQHPNILAVESLREVGSRITLAHPSVWCLFIVMGTETEQDMIELAHELNENVKVEIEPVSS